ncbi:hypothetical protein PCAR4_10170 [Paraburkholderia caribensis]|nr:hypothetical protein PCAR4_10170 [Paraburkholderia caribensis]
MHPQYAQQRKKEIASAFETVQEIRCPRDYYLMTGYWTHIALIHYVHEGVLCTASPGGTCPQGNRRKCVTRRVHPRLRTRLGATISIACCRPLPCATGLHLKRSIA